MSNEDQKYYLTVYNTCTGVYETVEVTKEVYIGYKRSKWKIENNDRSFYKHEIQLSGLIGGDDGSFDYFKEFRAEDANFKKSFEKDSRLERAKVILRKMPTVIRRRFILHYYYKMTCEEIASIENVSVNAIKKSLKKAQKRIQDILSTANKNDE